MDISLGSNQDSILNKAQKLSPFPKLRPNQQQEEQSQAHTQREYCTNETPFQLYSSYGKSQNPLHLPEVLYKIQKQLSWPWPEIEILFLSNTTLQVLTVTVIQTFKIKD